MHGFTKKCHDDVMFSDLRKQLNLATEAAEHVFLFMPTFVTIYTLYTTSSNRNQ